MKATAQVAASTTGQFSAAKNLVLPSALAAADFGSIGTGTSQQVTYETRPLYYFANDNARCDVNGHNVGSVWFLEDIQ